MSKPIKKESNIQAMPEKSVIMSTIGHLVKNACCVFTLCSVLLVLINWLMGGEMEGKTIYVDAFLLLLPFSLCVATASFVRLREGLSVGVKFVVHPLLCMGGLLLVYLPYMNRNGFSGGQVLVHWMAFAAAYGLLMLLVCLLSGAFKGKKAKSGKRDETYVSMFGHSDQDGSR